MPQISIVSRSFYVLFADEGMMKARGSGRAITGTFKECKPDHPATDLPQRQDAESLAKRVADLEYERAGLQRLICELLSKNEKLRRRLSEANSKLTRG
jgi:hypothetical protein